MPQSPENARHEIEDRPDANPIHAILDAAEVPWRSTRAALHERYGSRAHPAYQWEIIDIETTRPVAAGLIWPLCVQVSQQFSPHMPATEFTGIISFGADARENLGLTAEQFLPRLGEPSTSELEQHPRPLLEICSGRAHTDGLATRPPAFPHDQSGASARAAIGDRVPPLVQYRFSAAGDRR